jgi:hypothetical protein
MRWVGHITRIGEVINGDDILVGKPKGKRLLRRRSRGWEDNIKMIVRV